MSKFDQAKMLMKVKKLQKELEKEIITVETGDGAKGRNNRRTKDKKGAHRPRKGRSRRHWRARALGRRRSQRCHTAKPKASSRKNAAVYGHAGKSRTLTVYGLPFTVH